MAALSDEIETMKIVHTYGVGLHSNDLDPDVHDPRWQRRQVDEFVEFAVLAEELGFDGRSNRPRRWPPGKLRLGAEASPEDTVARSTRSAACDG